MHALDRDTIRLLDAGQIIVDLDAIVKELIENSLDAHAKSIDVKDNGSGILEEDRLHMTKCHWTSKISRFEDINNVSTFGFRGKFIQSPVSMIGEALHSICAISNTVSITTKTDDDDVARCYTCNSNGDIIKNTASPTISSTGTIVAVNQPFCSIPVRRQIAQNNSTAIVKKVLDWIIFMALPRPDVRFSFLSFKDSKMSREKIWIKPVAKNLIDNITTVYGVSLTDMIQYYTISNTDTAPFTLQCLLPQQQQETRNRLFNIEPNKTAVIFHNRQSIINLMESLLNKIYTGPDLDSSENSSLSASPSQEVNSDDSDSDSKAETEEKTNPWEFTMFSSSEEGNDVYELESSTDYSELGYKVPSYMEWSTTNSSQKNSDKSTHSSTELQGSDVWDIGISTDKSNDRVNRGTESEQNISALPRRHKNTRQPQVISWYGESSSNIPLKRTPSPENIQDPKRPAIPIATSSGSKERSSKHAKNDYIMWGVPRERSLDMTNTSSLETPDRLSSKPVPHSTGVPRHRTITGFLSEKPKSVKTHSANTLNNEMTVKVDHERLSKYQRGQYRRNHFHRRSMEDYYMSTEPSVQSTIAVFNSPQLGRQSLSVYVLYEIIHLGKCIEQIGVVHTKRAQSIQEFTKLMNTHKLGCDIVLETPVNIIQSSHDIHFQTLLSLMGYQKQVQENGIAQSEKTYTVITDPRIVNNGFNVRWHRDSHSGEVKVQILAICSIPYYGPSDWRDLLENIRQNPNAPFGHIRPNKAIEYLATKAYSTSDDTPVPLEPLLRGLSWQDSIGKYEITPTYSHTIAYSLSGSIHCS
ncbi:hypothetical protein PHYBLDRAFT_141366 [Phycomyces blakesleeanus NRRL 1555(-)]|uniref:DNA mismatch repair protein S5 domain-containing protein n=1 Tax=Phycomyces blakesleeanus (strain ATCC 8743b / DSM 1359 / FGSC 10004 / NBRC 33097 / NRRL 1555) TaxID=763407 RepID=A0A167P8R7_PHYB8|nr:hypothetical protein PHYBLDRAFT_141366 [Phycomyces blakesleeanus NRRL 1555(-)]OAD77479.1 hypothetical protein PHYBLDRAFT_141366 [Phycomyces blakesleeanus NRRL 1555(-)]|eukprot:XP_018295519.1 hypothetical protein PHYBLDRAFT_141366 [Phycomyces blakesleeanus NRRL 1555(-)]